MDADNGQNPVDGGDEQAQPEGAEEATSEETTEGAE